MQSFIVGPALQSRAARSQKRTHALDAALCKNKQLALSHPNKKIAPTGSRSVAPVSSLFKNIYSAAFRFSMLPFVFFLRSFIFVCAKVYLKLLGGQRGIKIYSLLLYKSEKLFFEEWIHFIKTVEAF
jgi:hypothetical protein